MERADGRICQTPEENYAEVQEFYQALYTTQGFRPMDDLLNYVPPRVTEQMNDRLYMPYTAEEVRTVLFQMAPSKAPGVDGFTAGFFRDIGLC